MIKKVEVWENEVTHEEDNVLIHGHVVDVNVPMIDRLHRAINMLIEEHNALVEVMLNEGTYNDKMSTAAWRVQDPNKEE